MPRTHRDGQQPAEALGGEENGVPSASAGTNPADTSTVDSGLSCFCGFSHQCVFRCSSPANINSFPAAVPAQRDLLSVSPLCLLDNAFWGSPTERPRERAQKQTSSPSDESAALPGQQLGCSLIHARGQNRQPSLACLWCYLLRFGGMSYAAITLQVALKISETELFPHVFLISSSHGGQHRMKPFSRGTELFVM